MIDTTLFGLDELLKQLYWVHVDDDLADAKQLIPAIRHHREWADFDLAEFHCFLSFLLVDAVARSARSWIIFLLDDGVDVTEEVICQSLSPGLSDEDALFTLELLHEKGWDVNSRRADGTPYLHISAARSDDILVWFLDNGADVNLTNLQTGDSTLDAAANTGSLSTLRLLQRHKARSMSGAALQLATVRSEPDSMILPIMDILIQEYQVDINHIDDAIDTPLHAAIWSRSVTRVRLLLQNGADPTIAGTIRGSPLSYVCDIGHPEMETLLRNHAEQQLLTQNGWIVVEEEYMIIGTDSEDDFETCIVPTLEQFSALSMRV